MNSGQLQRFMDKVIMGDSPLDCWQWTGARMRRYGKFKIASYTLVPAHRASFAHWHGPISEGMTIDHLCGNTLCVNPWHLDEVTLSENIKRAVEKRPRRTHCSKGHEMVGHNAILVGARGVVCRTCRNAYYWDLKKNHPERLRQYQIRAQENRNLKKAA